MSCTPEILLNLSYFVVGEGSFLRILKATRLAVVLKAFCLSGSLWILKKESPGPQFERF